MFTGKFKKGDTVRVVSKSVGDSILEVEDRYLKKHGSEWNHIAQISERKTEFHGKEIDYVVGGNFYKEEDLRFLTEDDLPSELFEL